MDLLGVRSESGDLEPGFLGAQGLLQTARQHPPICTCPGDLTQRLDHGNPLTGES